MIDLLKAVLFGQEVQEVPHQPVPPRDAYIPGFNEVFRNVKREIKKSHVRKVYKD